MTQTNDSENIFSGGAIGGNMFVRNDYTTLKFGHSFYKTLKFGHSFDWGQLPYDEHLLPLLPHDVSHGLTSLPGFFGQYEIKEQLYTIYYLPSS